jgi:WbqC-like protein
VILTAHQPMYLPWLGLFAKMAQADKFCFFDCCPMEDSGWENRNQIKTSAGIQILTVPVRRSRDVMLSDLRIVNEQPWQRKHWRSIEMAYRKAPYFDWLAPQLKPFYEQKWARLSDLTWEMLHLFRDLLGIETEIVQASNYRFEGAKSELVLDMCRKLGAQHYIFGEKGRDYANVEAFKRAGISVSFQAFKHPVYPQLFGEFVPRMSVIDLLFNVGPESGRVIHGAS